MAQAGNVEGTLNGTYSQATERGASRAAAWIEAAATSSDAAISRAPFRASPQMTRVPVRAQRRALRISRTATMRLPEAADSPTSCG